ncbi:membrane hypothetical protein [Tenacibaculum maritimum]|nr:membrane hypothetical protein [Tenacibaculum maritimum]
MLNNVYYPIYISIRLTSKKGALIIVGLLTSSIIFGGAFHSHFPYLGMISRYENTELLNVSQEYLMIMLSVTLILNFLGYGILTYYILCKRTVYPRWMVLCSPLVLVFFGNLIPLIYLFQEDGIILLLVCFSYYQP